MYFLVSATFSAPSKFLYTPRSYPIARFRICGTLRLAVQTGAVHRIRTCKAFRLNCFQGSSLTTRTDSIYKVETVGFEPTPDKSDKITLTSLHSLWEKFPYMWHLPLYIFTLGGIVRIFSNGLYSFPSTKMEFLDRLLKNKHWLEYASIFYLT